MLENKQCNIITEMATGMSVPVGAEVKEARWPSGLDRWLGLATGRFPAGFESHCGKLSLRNFGNWVILLKPGHKRVLH